LLLPLLLQSEIQHTISNSKAAEFLLALLHKDPAQRPDPQAALQGFAWLQPEVQPALQLAQQQLQQWPQQRQDALRAAHYIELLQLQQEVHQDHKAVELAVQAGAAVSEGAGVQAGPANDASDTWGAWDARDSTGAAASGSSSSSSSSSLRGGWARKASSTAGVDTAAGTTSRGTHAQDHADKAAAAAGAAGAGTIEKSDGWGLTSNTWGATAAAASADAWGSSSSDDESSGQGDGRSYTTAAAVGHKPVGERPSYSSMLQRNVPAAAVRADGPDLAPLGEQQHDGW
jgi:hypothetical protein